MTRRRMLELGGYSAMLSPPFDYDEVVSRVLPLRADRWQLRNFCDEYLNVAPEIAHFEPLMPYVTLAILSYGRMTSARRPDYAVFTQNEILFQIPLLWTDKQTGKKQVAVVAPYIFVDNELSAAAGREIYGWPKEHAWFEPTVGAWGKNPTEAERLLSVATFNLTETGPVQARLLEVTQQTPSVALDLTALPLIQPELLGESVWLNPARAMQSISALADACLWLGLGTFNFARGALPDFLQRAVRLGSARSLVPSPLIQAINLKQFADAVAPGAACYQALTVTPLEITQLTATGLLGERAQLALDSSGGYRVRIADDPTRPIVQRLGLLTDLEEHSTAASSPAAGPPLDFPAGTRIRTLRPVCPYWTRTNLRQHRSSTICARDGLNRDWRFTTERDSVSLHVSVAVPAKRWRERESTKLPYNGYLGAQLGLAPGSPLSLHGVTRGWVGLSADPAALDDAVHAVNSPGAPWTVARLRPEEGVVTVMLWRFAGMTAHAALPWLEGLELGFYIPVRVVHTSSGEAIEAWYPLCSFASSPTYVNVTREVLGGNVTSAKIRETGRGLLPRPSDERLLTVLELSTLTVSNFGINTTGILTPLLQICTEKEPADSASLAPRNPTTAPPTPMRIVRVKQFPDASSPCHAAYQALVCTEYAGPPTRSRRTIPSPAAEPPRASSESPLGFGPADASAVLRIVRCASHPIAEVLGLQASRSDPSPSPPAGGAPMTWETFRTHQAFSWASGPLTLKSQILWSFGE